MTKWSIPLCAALLLAAACGRKEPAEETGAPATDTVAMAPGGAETASPAPPESAATTTGGEATTAASAAMTGAPAPPGGYAVESMPAEGGQLAEIEYASPKTVAEVAEFYDAQIQSARRVEVDVAGDNLVAYGLSTGTTLSAATTAQDIQRLLDQRTEPVVVISPWTVQRNDPLIRDLRNAGLNEQADQLLETKSKVTVIYAVQ